MLFFAVPVMFGSVAGFRYGMMVALLSTLCALLTGAIGSEPPWVEAAWVLAKLVAITAGVRVGIAISRRGGRS